MNANHEAWKAREVQSADALLTAFRELAESMQTAPQDWQWIGPHMSQRMFGISEQRAKEYAARHGGTASKL